MTTPRIPIGYRFLPTVQETLIKYLKPKIVGGILPQDNPLREVNIYSCHPSELFNDLEDNDEDEIERYFYTTLKKANESGRNYNRKINKVGKWDGEYQKKILDVHGQVIGFDKYFKYAPIEIQEIDKTMEWKMHEYSINPELLPQGTAEEKKNLVVCRMVMIMKGNKQAKNKTRVIRLGKPQPLSCTNAVPNMMMMHPPQINYVFTTAEQDIEPTSQTQGDFLLGYLGS
ncbi:hypothetical protein BVRB_2g047470 [Beta vulgaris subsp. vulgaris]|uniref:NAC domain-containing protein n=1 Tax=Beta vulgaris subsp. vulgaris TaxID=3555 RepID=A0A0J8BCT0_BETVV|nr:hypothetical protein BVRB_2g047470 [Beta vulgaris subsp. vulgaris]